jgi:ribonuclease BN (tRNA processing enzyme)
MLAAGGLAMQLRVLGSSGGYPAPGNPSTGFFLEHGETRLWLDAGSGTFAELQRVADFTRLDALLLSHVHADHCADLYPLHVAIAYGVGGGFRLPVYAPPGARETLGGLLGPDGAGQLDKAFEFQVIDAGGAVEIGGVRFTFLRTDHPIHTLALRAETAAGTLTYSSDTGPGADLAAFARGSDLLLCEANYQDARMGPPFHLSARQAADTARRAGAGALALTHVWPTLDPEVSLREARETAPDLRIEWAGPGRTFRIGRGD